MDRNKMGTLFLGLGVGALLGVGITMLTTPWSGREARQRVRGAVDTSGDAIRRGYENVKERARTYVSRQNADA
jgi:gas vesicle protein